MQESICHSHLFRHRLRPASSKTILLLKLGEIDESIPSQASPNGLDTNQHIPFADSLIVSQSFPLRPRVCDKSMVAESL